VDERSGRRLARSTAIFSLATGLSRILGLVREVVAAYYFGATGRINAFTVAFQVPNLVRALVADAALQSAFVPVFTELLEKGDTILTTFDGYAGLAEGDSAGEAVAAPSQAAAKTTSLGRVFLFIVASFRALPGGSRSLRKDSTNSGPQTIGAGTKLGARPRDRAAFATAWCRRKACSS